MSVNGISSGNNSGNEVAARSAAVARPRAEQARAEQAKSELKSANVKAEVRTEQPRAEQAKRRAAEPVVNLGVNQPAPEGSPTGTRVRIKA